MFKPTIQVGGEAMVVTYLGDYLDAGSGSSYTFSSVNFGDAASDRIIVVGIGYRLGGSNVVTSATIGGVSATIPQAVCSTAGAAIIYADVPTGTSGTVYFAGLTAGADAGYICVWSITGASSSTPYATDAAVTSGTNETISLNIPAGGAQMCVGANSSSYTATWTNATEEEDTHVDSVLQCQSTLDIDMSAETPRTVTNTPSSSTPVAVAGASWI